MSLPPTITAIVRYVQPSLSQASVLTFDRCCQVFKASASLEAPTKTPKDEEGSMLFETLSIESGHDISSTEVGLNASAPHQHGFEFQKATA